MILGLVVEGHGDVEAAPVLLRRVVEWVAPGSHLEILRPYRVKRQQIVKPGEIERVVTFMGRSVGRNGGLIVLLDADDDCPGMLGPSLLTRARTARPDGPVAVVLANREFEAWFLAATQSIRGARTLPNELDSPVDPEGVRGAKEWLAERMARGYVETLDQPAFAALVDLAVAATRSNSFNKLVREVSGILRVVPPPRSSVV